MQVIHLASCLLLTIPGLAELPDAPWAKQFALNTGTTERYSFTKSDFELAPYLGIDYRVTHSLRLGVSYSQSFQQNRFADWERLNNSVTFNLNYKIKEWGKTK